MNSMTVLIDLRRAIAAAVISLFACLGMLLTSSATAATRVGVVGSAAAFGSQSVAGRMGAKVIQKYDSQRKYLEHKSKIMVMSEPNSNLNRHLVRCRLETDWPYGCIAISPAQLYPQMASSDYARAMYADFDGQTQTYVMSWADTAGGIDKTTFTLDPANCGSGGYSYYLLFYPRQCTWGGVTIGWLYPHRKGRLTVTLTADGVVVFHQLLDVTPLNITKVGGDNQVDLVSQPLRTSLVMQLKDFEGNAPHYPVRSDTGSNGAMSYTITGPAKSGGTVAGNTWTSDGRFVVQATLGNKTGAYQIGAQHSDSTALTAPFVATAVARKEPDDNVDDEEGDGDEGCDGKVADPISIGIGNSFQQETDYARTGLSMLELKRSYNALGSKSRLMRNYWTTNFDGLVIPPPVAGAAAKVRRPDGRVIPFVLQSGVYQSLRPYFHGTLRVYGSGWQYVTEDNVTETYDSQGKWISAADASGRTLTATYDSQALLTKVTANTGESLTLGYNAYNQMIKATDHTGRFWTYTYNGYSNLTQLLEPDGVYHTYHYEAPSNPYLLTGISIGRSATPSSGERYVTWSYDSSDRAVSNYFTAGLKRFDIAYDGITGDRVVTDAVGNQSTYKTRTSFGRGFVDGVVGPGFASCGFADSGVERDANMNVIGRTAFGRLTQFGNFDAKGQYGFMVEAAGKPEVRQTNYLYDPRFVDKPTQISRPSVVPGQTKLTQLEYDASGNLIHEVTNGYRPDGAVVSRSITFQYAGPYGQLSQIDGPRTEVADITRFEYHATTKRLMRVTDPNGVVLRNNITYTPTGQIATEGRPNGLRVTYAYYPGTDQLKSISESGPGTTRTASWIYNDRRWVASLTFSDGINSDLATYFDYNAAGDLIQVSSANAKIVYTLDNAGNRTRESYMGTAAGNTEKRWVKRTFDAYGRVKALINPDNQTLFDLHPDGTLTSVTNGRNYTTTNTYDDFKRLTQTLDPGQIVTAFEYDNQDRPIRITDGNQASTDQVFDDLGNLVRLQSPDSGTAVFEHDAAGDVTRVVDALGQVTTYIYDAGNRVLTLDRIGAADDDVYKYDACVNGAGELCSVNNGIGDVSGYEYDPMGRIVKQTTNAGTVSYGYNAANQVVEITYPSQRKVLYRRDSSGQIIAVIAVDGGSPFPLATGITHLPYGPAISWRYGNGLTEVRQYDLQYRPLSYDASGRSTVSYGSYDGNSNPTQRIVNGDAQILTYDDMDRLDTASGLFGVRDYDYDAVGNRTNLIADSQGSTYAYASLSNRLASDTHWTYTHDANGNVISRQASDGHGFDYTYTANNRLLGVTDLTDPENVIGAYRYNALGQRTVKSTPYGDTRFVYGLSGELLAETLLDGSVIQEYVYLDGQPIALLGVPASPVQPFAVDQIVDNPTNISGCRSIRTSLAVNGSFIQCDGDLSFPDVVWNWLVPVSGTYTVSVMWSWPDNNPRCFRYEGGAPCIGRYNAVAPAPPVGSWATLGDLHLTAGTKGLWVDVGDRYTGSNLYRAELDAARFVLQYPDVNVRDYKYVHTDAMGTPLRATDKSGVVIWQAIYDPYGAAVVNDDPEGDGVHQALNLRLPGQYYDAETSLHYNYFRDYDPEIGRYLQSDPIGLAAGVNTYAYVGGNPISLIDPLGLAWEFNQSTGQLSHNGIPIGSGYAGHGAGVNNPTMQGVGGVGPLPQGSYTIGPQQLNITNSGTRLPGSMRLTPVPGNQMFDRSGFLIHGDNSRHNQSASEGCIVANKYLRDQIGSSGDNILEVYVPQLMPVIIPFW